MPLRFGINGLGRIGRALIRIAATRPELGLELAAANDSADPQQLARLLRHDTVHGSFPARGDRGRRDAAPRRAPGSAVARGDAAGDRLAGRWRRSRARSDGKIPPPRPRRRALRRAQPDAAPGRRLGDHARPRFHPLPRHQRPRPRPLLAARDLERFVHDQLPGAAAPRARPRLRRRPCADEHGALRHQQPEPGRQRARRSAPGALGARQHHPDHLGRHPLDQSR